MGEDGILCKWTKLSEYWNGGKPVEYNLMTLDENDFTTKTMTK